jgi:uncharacterized protein YjdB
MKKKLLLLPLAGILVYVALCGYGTGPGVTGGIDGTGASSTSGCNCHNYSTTTTVSIELDSAGVAVSNYVGGGSYTIKIKGTNTSFSSLPYFGFQIAAINLSGAGTASATNAGTLASTGLPASCRYTAAGTMSLPISVVEHSAPIIATTGTGGSGTTYVESIGWTAPVAGTGSIKLYGVVNAVNHDGSSSGDAWNNNNITIGELTTPTLAPITGTSTVCVGANTNLTSTYTTGTWSSSNTSVATVSAAGVVHGVGAGTTVISYNEGAAGTATLTVTVSAAPNAGSISGPFSVCTGSSITLTDGGTPGGTWSSTSAGVASVNSSGLVTGITAGTTNISYTVTNSCGTASAGKPLFVNPSASAGTITGASSVCAGSNITLTDTATGGVWNASNGNATVSGGVVTGISAGTDTITYSVTNFCGTATATHIVTISTVADAGAITGASTVCQGASVTLSDTSTGGTWSSSDNTIASVSAGGVVTGVAAGSVTIFYSVSNGCGSATANTGITVNPLPVVTGISGAHTVCAGLTDTLTDATTGGVWSISNAHASVDSTGIVTAISSGIDTVTYSITNSCGTTTARFVLAINGSTAGVVYGDTVLCLGHPVILSDTLPGGTWSVSNGNALISDGVVVGVTAGADTVTYTVSSSCGTAVSTFIVNIRPADSCAAVSVTNVLAAAGLTIYPNPSASGIFTLEMGQRVNNLTIYVSDLTGRIVTERSLKAVDAATLDLSDLHTGNYIIKVRADDVSYFNKVSIIK